MNRPTPCRWRFVLLLLFGAPLSLAGNEPLSIQHAQGETVLPASPQRAAVFDLGVLDTLSALGVEVAGVPQGAWPDHLMRHSDRTRIGTLFEPDYQALETLNPDLIIVAGRSRSDFEKLGAVAPTIDLSTSPGDFVADARRNLRTLGRIFDREAQAELLDAELGLALAGLRALGAEAGTALVLFVIGDNIAMHAPGERFGMIHEFTGMPSVLPPADPSTGGGGRPEAGSPEAQARRDHQQARLAQALSAEPDWLFVLDRGAATGGEAGAAAALARHPLVAASTAWRTGKIYYLDPPTWYVATGGYTGLLRTAIDVHRALEGGGHR